MLDANANTPIPHALGIGERGESSKEHRTVFANTSHRNKGIAEGELEPEKENAKNARLMNIHTYLQFVSFYLVLTCGTFTIRQAKASFIH